VSKYGEMFQQGDCVCLKFGRRCQNATCTTQRKGAIAMAEGFPTRMFYAQGKAGAVHVTRQLHFHNECSSSSSCTSLTGMKRRSSRRSPNEFAGSFRSTCST